MNPVEFECVRCGALAIARTEREVAALARIGWDAKPTTCPDCTPKVPRNPPAPPKVRK